MKRGQSSIMMMTGNVILIAVMVLIGLVVYGYVADVTPHDVDYTNESICTTCVNGTNGGTTYTFDNTPVYNDTSISCSNASGTTAMTNGVEDGTCLGFNVDTDGTINITNTSAENACQILNMECDYTYDWATDDEDSFWGTTTSQSFSGFIIAGIIAIVLAAVAIVSIIYMMRR